MALFNILYANHGDCPTQLEDIISYLRLALTEAGHTANISPFMGGRAFNIVIELFPDGGGIVEVIEDAVKKGVKFAVLATEFITGNTFNNFQLGETNSSTYSNRREWSVRHRNFMRVAQACKTVWCLTQEQLDGYVNVLPPSWLSLLPIGYVDGYATVEDRAYQFKDFDFIFTGTLTERRRQIMLSLQQAGTNVVAFKSLTPGFIRNNVVSRTKICLGLKQFDDWKYSSLIRNYYHLMNRSFILSEAYEVPSVIDKYITVADSANFSETCLQMLKQDNLSQLAAQNLERFREEMPLKPMFAEFLAQSFG